MGKIVRLVLLYDMHDRHRFPRGPDLVSYCRRVQCAKASAGKRYGTAGKQLGNASLQWAFATAAVLCLRHHAQGQTCLARLEKKHGTGNVLTGLAHKLARAVSSLVRRDTVFERDTCLHGYGSRAGEPAASLDIGALPCALAVDWTPALAP